MIYQFLKSLLFVSFFSEASGQVYFVKKDPQTIEELKIAINNVLQETNTPAAGIAMVNRTGSVLIEGFGMADIENGFEADEQTMLELYPRPKSLLLSPL